MSRTWSGRHIARSRESAQDLRRLMDAHPSRAPETELARTGITTSEDWQLVAEYLFDALDDIDTAEDIAQDNMILYRNLVRKIHRRRFEVGNTDGYSVRFHPRRIQAEERKE